ncbi:MAG: YceI family protein [Bacteroidota bacterium]
METSKHLRNTCALIAFCLLGIKFNAQVQAESDLLKLAVESNHSTILFSVPISNGITRITGNFSDYAIDIDYVDNDLAKSNVTVTIQSTSIDTGIDGRDEHLRTSDFFDIANYPEIKFESNIIQKTNIGYVAVGDFTMHGITKPMEIPIQITGRDGTYTFGFSSRFSIKRSDFDLGTEFKHTSIENFLGDEISVEVDFWTKKRKEKKKTSEE